MQEPGKEPDFERSKSSVRGLIDRIMAIEHPDAKPGEEDLAHLKAALTRYSSDLEHLSYRYEARGEELKRLKMQYEELEHKFQMRPDTMRRAGEMEITELVRKRHELSEQERSLEKARLELAKDRESLSEKAEETLAVRLAGLERAQAGREAQLREREGQIAAREAAAAGAEKHVRELVEEARKKAVDEATASFEREAAALESTFGREKTLLSGELAKWRLKAEETLAQLSEARKEAEETERRAEAAAETSAAARQKCKIAEMDLVSNAKRLEEWEKKGLEFERQRAELYAAAEKARAEARTLADRVSSLEASAAGCKDAAARLRETELPRLETELKAEKARVEALREELRGLKARLEDSEKSNSVLSASAIENGKAAELAKARCESEIPVLQADLQSAKQREEALRGELKGVREHLAKVLKESSALEEELEAAREKHLRVEAQRDAERTAKMEAIIEETAEKERRLQETWDRRHKDLETELRGKVAGMEKLFAQKEARLMELNKRMTQEFQDREARARSVEEELRAQASALAASSEELARDYEQKTAALEEMKQKAVAELNGAAGGNAK